MKKIDNKWQLIEQQPFIKSLSISASKFKTYFGDFSEKCDVEDFQQMLKLNKRSRGTMQEALKHIKDNNVEAYISYAYNVDDKLVGWAYYIPDNKTNFYDLQVYVALKERNKGLGQYLIYTLEKALKSKSIDIFPTGPIKVYKSNKNSSFWSKIKEETNFKV